MDNTFALHVKFISGNVVTMMSDNLLELRAIMRGLETANEEVPCIDSIALSGTKVYTFKG